MQSKTKTKILSNLFIWPIAAATNQWSAVTSESGHAICMPKSAHKNGYVMGN